MSTIALAEEAQNKMLRVVLRLFGLAGVLLLATGCSDCDYKFGLEEKNYPQYFGPDLPTNSAKRHNDEYSSRPHAARGCNIIWSCGLAKEAQLAPTLSVNADAPGARLRPRRGSPVILVR